MKIGFIGLGKMGSQMVKRLVDDGHEVIAFDIDSSAVSQAEKNGATVATDRESLVNSLDEVIIWLMIPSQFVDEEIDKLLKVIPSDGIIIDGGNSDYRLTKERYHRCGQEGVSFVDVGTSGGVLGVENGFSMMIGGDKETVQQISPLFKSLSRTNGWRHFGPSGSGHFIKMIHNGIEYGLMQSYAEGYMLMKEGPYKNIDLAEVGKVWENGSIVSSLLNELTLEALSENPELAGVDGYVAESGETRWAIETAKELGIDTPVINAAFQVRLDSQNGKTNFATKLLAAMRNKFGGHLINKESDK